MMMILGNAVAKIVVLLLVTQLVAAVTSTREDEEEVRELTVYNFASTVREANYTCILFYDGLDPRARDYSQVLEIVKERHPTANVALLDVRHHQYLRHIYEDEVHSDDEVLAQSYYTNFEKEPNSLLVLNSDTFMNFRLGTLYWPSSLELLGRDFNVYAQLNLGGLAASLPLQAALVERWYQTHTAVPLEDATPMVVSVANNEERRLVANQKTDNSFDFEEYFEELEEQESKGENDDTASETVATPDIRSILETGSRDDDSDDENGNDGDTNDTGHFVYQKANIKRSQTSYNYLVTLSTLLDRYLGWVEGYEVTWSLERKQREDEQCNFGFYLDGMNRKLQTLIRDLLLVCPSKDSNEVVDKKAEIPNLKDYFDEMVFGYGRSPASWNNALINMTNAIGTTANERRQNRNHWDGTEFDIIRRMREYMLVYANIHDDDNDADMRYFNVLAQLATDWHNIMRDFHNNLNQHYLQWLELGETRRPHGNQFQFQTMDVLDMNSKKDQELLTDYSAFHQKYTAAGIPVILSNVQMSPRQNITLDYLVETCGASDVTRKVLISHKVGKRPSGSGWGGLSRFVLDDPLLTESRITYEPKSSSDDSDDSSDDDDLVKVVDRSITMEQFVILHEHIDTLYLHDYPLPGNCDRLLYDDAVYSDADDASSTSLPKFRIPAVIANYDLFQRAMFTGYETTWPSLFVGRKGSNSKLHLDSGATGFFMYLVSGRKRWVVYNRDERPFLYENIVQHSVHADVLGANKNAAFNDFLSERFPLLHRAEGGYEIIQEPGQLVYIPPNSPHAVENLEDIVGIAMNFAPREGIAAHFHSLIHNDMEFDRFHITMEYLLFDDNAEHPIESRDPLYASFGEYKGQ